MRTCSQFLLILLPQVQWISQPCMPRVKHKWFYNQNMTKGSKNQRSSTNNAKTAIFPKKRRTPTVTSVDIFLRCKEKCFLFYTLQTWDNKTIRKMILKSKPYRFSGITWREKVSLATCTGKINEEIALFFLFHVNINCCCSQPKSRIQDFSKVVRLRIRSIPLTSYNSRLYI